MKKIYESPMTMVVDVKVDAALAAASPSDTFDPDKDDQEIKPGTGTHDGEFSSKGGYSLWDDEDE